MASSSADSRLFPVSNRTIRSHLCQVAVKEIRPECEAAITALLFFFFLLFQPFKSNQCSTDAFLWPPYAFI